MLVTIIQTFDTPGRRWLAGENPDVDPTIAAKWIADGKAFSGPVPQNPYPVSGAGVPKISRPAGLFLGDSITRYGGTNYQDMSRSTSDTPFGGSAFVIIAANWANGSGSGTLRFSKSNQALSWQAPGDTQGADINVSKAGVYTLPSGTLSKALTVVCRPRTYGTATEGSFTVTISANSEFSRRSGKTYGVWTQAKCNAAFDASFIGNDGSQILDLIDCATYQVPTSKYDFISLLVGANDVTNGRTFAQMQADYLQLLGILLPKTPAVFGLTLMPRASLATAAMRQTLVAFNQWLMTLKMPGFHPVNVFSRMVDPSSSTGEPLAGMLEDGIHPTITGAETMSVPVAAALNSFFQFDSTSVVSSQADVYDATNNPNGNQLPKGGTWSGTGGVCNSAGMSGVLADGCQGVRNTGSNLTCVHSQVARSDGLPGTAQRLTLSNPGASSEQYLMSIFGGNRPAAAQGQVWQMRGGFILASGTGLEYFQPSIESTTPGSSRYTCQWGTGYVAGAPVSIFGSRQTYETWPVEVQAGATTLIMFILIQIAAGGAAVIDLLPGEWKLARLS